MDLNEVRNYFESYFRACSDAFRSGRFEDALMSAIRGYVVATEIGDADPQALFRRAIWNAAYELVDKPDRDELEDARQGRRCSFCPRRQGEVEIIAGICGSICKVCAIEIPKRFDEPPVPEGGGLSG